MGDSADRSDGDGFEDDLDPISREAVDWFMIRHADGAAGADDATFRRWLESDPRRRAAYADVERLWSGAADLPLVAARRRAARAKLTRRAFGKTALLVAAGGGGGWLAHRQHWLADHRTGAGERKSVALPDHSTVELSASTAMSIEFGASLRRVRLHYGEAFFSVARDEARGFDVEAAAGRIETREAAFNVDYIADDDVRVTVAERDAAVRLGAQRTLLGPGRRVAYGRRIDAVEDVDPAVETAWRDGRLVFVSQPLRRVIAALDRWRPGKLVLASAEIADRPVTLIVDVARSAAIVEALEDALPIRTVRLTHYLTLIFAA